MRDWCCRSWRLARKTCGFSLVFAATASPALAFGQLPEIDPGSMGSALALLTGGFFLLTDRFRKK